MIYEAVWYNGWVEPPGYFLVETVEGVTAEEALLQNLTRLTQQVRDLFSLDNWPDEKIQETLYVFPTEALEAVLKVGRIVAWRCENPTRVI